VLIDFFFLLCNCNCIESSELFYYVRLDNIVLLYKNGDVLYNLVYDY